MEKATRKYLAKVAAKAAQIPFHGYIEGKESNLEPVIRFFPKWTLREADGLWCAAFVYYCCREAGFEIWFLVDGPNNARIGIVPATVHWASLSSLTGSRFYGFSVAAGA